MPIENEPLPLPISQTDAQVYAERIKSQSVSDPEIDPNNPPWGLAAGFLTWAGSVLLLLGMAIAFVIPYVVVHFPGKTKAELEQILTTDKTVILLQILSTVPAHLLTLGIVWAVVTRFGKRRFWRTLGFTWSERVGVWTSIGLAVGLLIVGVAISQFIGGEPTSIDQIINSSNASRYSLALLAATTAPLVEELVYRGVLYSAIQKSAGMVWAVIGVSILFVLVHLLQYYNNIGVIVAISILSLSLTLVRAFSGRLLPCVVIHFIFNGLQSVYIILQPYIEQPASNVEQKAAIFRVISRCARALV
ncbi:MAG: protease family protein [Acidobacteriota bacterium]|nr:protease family protein [Acidobacteriota bacterium]